jgi:ubiquinone/menaquinone biosynthesis C-methylase UbiE
MDKWLKYWQQDALQPDVFTDKQGNKHIALQQFWQRHVANFDKGSCLLDIASGAGAIYRCLPDIADYDAHALDISEQALQRLKLDMPTVGIHAQLLDEKSFDKAQFDGVFSQFGIEYLGKEGFSHVPRLLKDGAKCVFLNHIKGGVVDTVTQQSLKGLLLIEQTKFLQLAHNVAIAFKEDKKKQVEQSVKVFMQVEPTVAQYCNSIPKGHHVHLYDGVKQLLSRYNKYEHIVVLDWINAAKKQACENTERLQSMHDAALDASDIKEICEELLHLGLKIMSTKPFYLRQDDPPAAWEIIGVKQN